MQKQNSINPAGLLKFLLAPIQLSEFLLWGKKKLSLLTAMGKKNSILHGGRKTGLFLRLRVTAVVLTSGERSSKEITPCWTFLV